MIKDITALLSVIGLVLYISLDISGCIHDSSPRTIYQKDTTTVQETTYVSVEKIKYRNLPARIETVYVDTFGDVQTANAEEVINEDTVKVQYVFPPLNSFSIELYRKPQQTIFITKTVEVPRIEYIEESQPWYVKPLWFLAGYGTGSLIERIKR